MTYVLYGAALAFIWFLALNLLLSVIVAAIPERVFGAMSACAPTRRARVLLSLRLLPAAVSTIFVAGVFLPSFWRFEPRDFDEVFGITTTSLAFVACALLGTAVRRGALALRESAQRSRAWLEHATPMAWAGAPAPVYCLEAAAPAMTLVGVIRPKLLVTQPLIDALTAEELNAAVAHEASHLESWDNLKRLAMRAMPDALSMLPASRRLELRWALAAEHAADARAARDSNAGLALASALVKVARLTPADRPMLGLASPLVGGDALTSRVARLMEGPPAQPSAVLHRALYWPGAIAAATAAAAAYAPLLHTVHRVSEAVVHVLP